MPFYGMEFGGAYPWNYGAGFFLLQRGWDEFGILPGAEYYGA